MSGGELEILSNFYPTLYRLRWTANTREIVPNSITNVSDFQFSGGEWKLQYGHYGDHHFFELEKMSGHCPFPFKAWLQVEVAGIERIVTGLSTSYDIVDDFSTWNRSIFSRDEDDIQLMVPEFSRNPVLTFIVFLRAAISPEASQMNCSNPKGFEVSCLESLSADFAQLMDEGSNPDVVFKCAGQSIRAHGTVVCARSAVIKAMLGSEMIEGRNREINIPDMEPDVLKRFLRYVYCGKLDELTYDVALTLYKCGDKYAVSGLAKRCSQFLLANLTTNNVLNVLVLADLHSDRGFAEKVISYIVKFRLPEVSDQWSIFCKDYPQLAVKVLNHGGRKSCYHQYRLRPKKVPKK